MEQSKPIIKICPHCRKEVDALAKKCPYCQSKLKVPITGRQIVWICIIAFIGIMFIALIAATSPNGVNLSTDDNYAPPAPQPSALQVCLNLAQQNYSDTWDASCKAQGDAANCKLNSVQALVLDNRLQGDKNDCYRNFPQN